MTELRRNLFSSGSIGSQPPYYIVERMAHRFGFAMHDWSAVPALARWHYTQIWNAEQLAARDRKRHGAQVAKFEGR